MVISFAFCVKQKHRAVQNTDGAKLKKQRCTLNKFILISGCSGGGKSTLLAELGKRGHAIVAEPGRRIIAAQTSPTAAALPWVDMTAFAHRAVEMALLDLSDADQLGGLVFFDRGVVDAAIALEHSSGVPYFKTLGQNRHYFETVFLTPPWPEIFSQDKDRRHNFSAAIEEFERLERAFSELGYDIILLPKVSPSARADFVLNTLKGQ